MSPLDALERPVWNLLNGPQADLAQGGDLALRIDPTYGPFAAARDGSAEALNALAALVAPGEVLWLIEPEAWPAPLGMRVLRVAELVQMVAAEPSPPRAGDEHVVRLGSDHTGAMTDLALATKPGPWGEQTCNYGQFYGVLREGTLAAMAGERMRPAPGLAEVSGVCTWPQYRGQGLAGQLIRRVMAGFTARGDVPILHSYAANTGAIGLYETLGFVTRRVMVATVLVKE